MRLILLILLIGSIWIFKVDSITEDVLKTARIVIVGGGAAGISALSRLLENGYTNVVLLEAQDYMGGRVSTIPFGANVVDLGGQWVHGEVDNVVFEMVQKYNVLDRSPYSWLGIGGRDGLYISSQGEAKTEYGELSELSRIISGESEHDIVGFVGATGTFFSQQYWKELGKQKYRHISKENAEQFLDYWEKQENIDDSSDSWFYTSASGYNRYWDNEGWENLNWKDKGYGHVFNYITHKLPDPRKDLKVETKIQFNKVVKNINYEGKTKDPVIVSCTDGSTYTADHVIVTVSLGVLKHDYKSMFTPPVPVVKQDAILGLSFGTMDKMVLEFDKPFWPYGWPGFAMIWTKEDIIDVITKEFSWVKDIAGFWPISYQPNLLYAFTTGPTARRLETMDKDEMMNGVMYLFEKFLKKNIEYTKPKQLIVTKWHTNPHFRGSYSFVSLTTDEYKTSARKLAQPIQDSSRTMRILFAGEATSDHYYSTVHGAVETGYREANRLINYYKY